jgi:hypothetical protein
MTLAKAESDSLRRCIIIRDPASGGGVDNPPRPELLPLELLLFSSIGSSLLRVVAATPTGGDVVVVEFQLVKNWAKSQSFSIYLRVTGVVHIQNETTSRAHTHTHTHNIEQIKSGREPAEDTHTQKKQQVKGEIR